MDDNSVHRIMSYSAVQLSPLLDKEGVSILLKIGVRYITLHKLDIGEDLISQGSLDSSEQFSVPIRQCVKGNALNRG